MKTQSPLAFWTRSTIGAWLALAAGTVLAEIPTLTVQVSQPGAVPTQYGVFFEDINYGADGGLYPERIKNRSFEFPEPLLGWKPIVLKDASGEATVETSDPLNSHNPHYLRVKVAKAGHGYGLSNEGFFGMGFQQGQEYEFSVMARCHDASPMKLVVEAVRPNGDRLAISGLTVSAPGWKRYACTLRSASTDPKARLNLLVASPGAVDLDMVSLFPHNTWKNRPNGLRPDLVKWLAEMKPAFLRFPGGCIVEGRDLSKRYQWKNTIGSLDQRRLIINRWNDEFKHRPAPDYFQSFGLGFYEYFQLCEDIGAAPLPILNCGMACQFNTGELVPLNELDPFIQDALDLIEFANGPASSPWGSRRAAMGHPAPFNMRLLGIGNEQWGPQYIDRYERFAKVLKARHPEIQLVSSAGPRLDDDLYQFLWPKLRELKADIVDEHIYASPDYFYKNAFRYDRYQRGGPKVFMGEYAVQSVKVASPDNRNNWECALAEAAFMTGLERNSDVVAMASYAPLFAHVEGWQWTPDLIWMDNLRSFATPNYYVQQLFSLHRGTRVLPVKVNSEETSPTLYASAAWDDMAREVIVKCVNASPNLRVVRLDLAGARKLASEGRAIVLASGNLKAENSLDQPTRIVPREKAFTLRPPELAINLEPYSLTVLRVPVRPRQP